MAVSLARAVADVIRDCGIEHPWCSALSACADQLVSHPQAAAWAHVYSEETRRHCETRCLVFSYEDVPLDWRGMYMNAALLAGAAALCLHPSDPSFWLAQIREVDMALIKTRASDTRARLAHSIIEALQREYILAAALPRRGKRRRGTFAAPSDHLAHDVPLGPEDKRLGCLGARRLPSANTVIARTARAPTLAEFRACWPSASLPYGRPLIVRGYARSWPACALWAQRDYLVRRAGPGRVVPVETGRAYTDSDWGQSIMPWAEFLDQVGWGHQDACLRRDGDGPPLYLAQHTLLDQFPWLADDIHTPLYATSYPPRPPYLSAANRPRAVTQVWLGPAGTVSPAHTDTYYNCFVQVVGAKSVWIAPPDADRDAMCVLGASDGDLFTQHMANTSRVDVWTSDPAALPPPFVERVAPCAQCAVLQAGDMLFLPPLWWHAMRSESQVRAGATDARARLYRFGSRYCVVSLSASCGPYVELAMSAPTGSG